MINCFLKYILCTVLFITASCTSNDRTSLKVPELQKEPLPFPRYLLPEGVELKTFCRIPGSSSVSIDITSMLALDEIAVLYKVALESVNWKISEVDQKQNFLWMKAGKRNGDLEFRAVQGAGIVSLFLVYDGPEGDI